MDAVKVKAHAKINLTLDICGVKDGYHLIDSVVSTVDISDLISVKKRKKDKLVSVTMHGLGSESIPFESNNAARAAQAFVDRYETCGVDIVIYKNIPLGAGLGGSSADASGTLNAMKKLFSIDDDAGVKELADSVGSDSGYMLYGGLARIRGRGEEVTLFDKKRRLYIGLLTPKTGVSTAQCYSLYDKMPTDIRTSDQMQNALLSGDLRDVGNALSNGLYAPAAKLNPDVSAAYEQLKEFDPLGVNMTGSGSAVYALFENDQFLRYAKSRYRGNFAFITTKTI